MVSTTAILILCALGAIVAQRVLEMRKLLKRVGDYPGWRFLISPIIPIPMPKVKWINPGWMWQMKEGYKRHHVAAVADTMLAFLPRHARRIDLAGPVRRYISSITKAPLAFAFDIDGVLIRGPDVIPGAQRALNVLKGHNPLGIFLSSWSGFNKYTTTSELCLQLTNGGGEFEHVKSEKLSKQLGVHIEPEQMIQSHTIMRQLAHKYASKPVLVLGGKHDMGRRIAHSYGFQDVYIPVDFLAWEPSIWPLGAEFVSDADLAQARKADFTKVPFAAVFVIHDPRPSWFLEIQVLTDVLRNQYCTDQPPPELVFCNPDLVWRGQFHRVRLGQGAFRDAFQAVYTALEGAPYPYTQYGKPTKDTYDFAHDTLARLVKRAGGQPSTTQYYMIGDNPESDVAGANAAAWHSVLVHTGVYDRTRGPPTHMPTEFADNVEAAVALAFERECGVKL